MYSLFSVPFSLFLKQFMVDAIDNLNPGTKFVKLEISDHIDLISNNSKVLAGISGNFESTARQPGM